MREVGFLVLGWLFGLLSPQIVDAIKRRHLRKERRQAIFGELKQAQIRLALMRLRIAKHLGILERSLVKWVCSHLSKCKGTLDEVDKLLPGLEALSNMSDEQLKTASIPGVLQGRGMHLPTLSLPYLESMTEALSIFRPEFQQKLLAVGAQAQILREQLEISQFFFRLTFDPSAMNTNGDCIRGNVDSSYKNIETRCKVLVETINEVLDE